MLVGDGTLADAHGSDASFAQLRLLQFYEGLSNDGHEVHVLNAAHASRAQVQTIAPDAVVSAGTWAPVRVAVAIAGDLPLSVDLPGDPFADAQAAAFAEGSTAHVAGVDAAANAAKEVFLPALQRADAFTTIGAPARHALLGQLGVLGRLARTRPGHENVFVTPIAWRFPGLAPAEPRAHRVGDALVVALVGGFNTWLDEESLLRGFLAAMDVAPVHVIVIGGPIPGHHEAGFARFISGAQCSPYAANFRFLPRLDGPALADVLSCCHVLTWIDRAGAEPVLGSRTRALLALHQGLRIVATARCALAQELAAGGWLTPLRDDDPGGNLAATLAGWASAGAPALPFTAPLAARYGVSATTEGLRAWVAAIARRPRPR